MYWFTDKILILVLMLSFSAKAQQNHFYSQFNLSSLSINPAYTGSKNMTEVMLSYRKQWIQMDGAPTTFSAGIHTSKETSKLGYGLLFTRDQIGISSSIWLTPSLSYTLKLGQEFALNFGLSAGFVQFTNDWNSVSTNQSSDPIYSKVTENKLLPSVGAGLYLYSNKAYIGFSIPNMLENEYFSETTSTARQVRHYFLQAGKVFTLNPTWDIKGELVLKTTSPAIIQYDLRASVIYIKKVMVGLNYRHQTALTPNVQFYINKALNMGYSYDLMLNSLDSYQSGTHELFLSYSFKAKDKIIDNPRFF